MANMKRDFDLVRVNVNLPEHLLERVKDYANECGLPMTQAYISLLNIAFKSL